MKRFLHNQLLFSANNSDSYWFTRLYFIRGLGFIYLIAFLIVWNQGPGLFGKTGLLPIEPFVNEALNNYGGRWASFWKLPSLFYFFEPEIALRVFPLLGLALSAVLIAGFANFFILFALWTLHLSFVNSGQLFYSYGWESQLLELTFLAFFLCPFWHPNLMRPNSPPKKIAIWGLRWMLFRLMLGAGLIKLRGDHCWADLTCLIYHYETQPNPHPLSWFIHHMPAWLHKGGVLFNHFVEIIVPFGLFGPRRLRRTCAVLVLAFQGMLIFSGNLSWLNWVTLVMCIPCLDDRFFNNIQGWVSRTRAIPQPMSPSKAQVTTVVLFALTLIALSYKPALNLASPRQAMNTSYNRWHLINSYGAFGSVGNSRNEIVIKGTTEDHITPQTVWKEFEFKCKPGDVSRTPCWITPYHLRLDWQIWFSAMRPQLSEVWLFRLAVRILENDEKVLDLIEPSPFGAEAPKFIKMDLYNYRFSDVKDWPKKWWQRKFVQRYMPPVSLDTPMVKRFKSKRSWSD